jgi:antitoxin component of MazEF toxin-antitoxin module
MVDEFEYIDARDVSVRGGSLSITLPPAVAEALHIQAGDKIVFLRGKEDKRFVFEKMQEAKTTSGLSFSFSVKETKKK